MKAAKAEKRNAGKVFVKCSVKAQKVEKSVRIGVLGASGYTGSEVYLSRNSHKIPLVFISFLFCG